MEDERTTYRAIREWAMDSAYEVCRSLILLGQRNGFETIKTTDVFAAFFDETYECFETDLEELMWRSLEMILDRGLGPQAVRHSALASPAAKMENSSTRETTQHS